MRANDPASCKPFGKQVCILILDCFWGWLYIVPWIKKKYPWIRLVFVPGSCTPVAQPMDRGVIAKIKAILRRYYSTWVIELVRTQLGAGTPPEAIQVPSDVPTCRPTSSGGCRRP